MLQVRGGLRGRNWRGGVAFQLCNPALVPLQLPHDASPSGHAEEDERAGAAVAGSGASSSEADVGDEAV
jgi:hypothetical protein